LLSPKWKIYLHHRKEGGILSSILREKTLAYIEKYGTTKKHIAKKLGVSATTVSLFLKGERELGEATEKLLRQLIESD
jgi:predicted transcriptional regulator